MNTRQLRHFLAVMDLGSLTAAAQAVHLSVPALSRSLRALEDALRVPLFDRTERRLQPTPYARAYLPRARRIAFDESEGARALDLMRAGGSGTLAFGMGSSIAHPLLAPMVLELLGAAPGLRIMTMVQSTDVLRDALVREQLDFFVGDVRIAAGDADLTAEPMHACTFGWFARSEHPLAGRRRVPFADVSRYPLVSAGYADPTIERRIAELYEIGLPLADQFAVTTSDLGTLHALLTSSDAVAPSTDIAVRALSRVGRVAPIDVIPALDLELTLGIVRRTGRTLVPAAERAFSIVRRFFAEARGIDPLGHPKRPASKRPRR